MNKANLISETFVKVLLFAFVAVVFLVASVALGNVVFGILAGAFYIYEVSRI